MELAVRQLVAGGDGIAEWDGMKVFVRGAAPKEIVRARLLERRRDYAVAETVEVLNASPDRRIPPCPLFGMCGGCQLQHLNYSGQLAAKRFIAEETLRRLGHLSLEAATVHPAPVEWHYRNKTQYPVQTSGVGFYRRFSHDLVNVSQCLLHPPSFDEIRRHFLNQLTAGLETPYSEPHHRGNIRHLILRTGLPVTRTHAIIVTRENTLNHQLVDRLIGSGLVAAVLQSHNPDRGNRILGSPPRLVAGTDSSIVMELAGLRIAVPPGAFFQVNTQQAAVLADAVVRLAGLQGHEKVLELYCGCGLLTLNLARYCRRVVGIEIDSVAVEQARSNATANGLDNATFHHGDVEALSDIGKAELVVLDPPRRGCSRQVLQRIAAASPRRIIYVSCNPATLARDVAFLAELNYRPSRLELIDMFPQTSHIESVCLIESNSTR